MHDLNFIRENPIQFDNAMKQRGEIAISKKILEIDEEKRKTQTFLQNLLSEKNNLSKTIGKLKSENKNPENYLKKVDEIKNEINTLKELETIKEDELQSILKRLPNIPHSSTPVGKSENDNLKDLNLKLITQFHVENSASNIEMIAKDTLGMIKKKPKKIILNEK